MGKKLLNLLSDWKCPAAVCKCANLYANAPAYIPSVKAKKCNVCGPIMVASAVKKTSALGKPLSEYIIVASEETHLSCGTQAVIRVSQKDLTKMGVKSAATELMVGHNKYCIEAGTTKSALTDACKPKEMKEMKSSTAGKFAYFAFPMDSCDSKLEKLTDAYKYTFTVTFMPKLAQNASIGRYNCSTMKMTCKIPFKAKTNSAAMMPVIKSGNIDQLSRVYNFNETVSWTKNGAAPITEGGVTFGDYIHIRVDLNGLKTLNQQIALHHCYASKSSATTKTPGEFYDFIDCNGCTLKSEASNVKQVRNFVDGNSTEIALKAFVWSKTMPACASRRSRRSLDGNDGQDRTVISAGPFHVSQPELDESPTVTTEVEEVARQAVSACQVNNGGCEDSCVSSTPSGDHTTFVKCVCNPGRVLHSDGKSCRERVTQRHHVIYFVSDVSFNYTTLLSMATLASVILSLSLFRRLKQQQ